MKDCCLRAILSIDPYSKYLWDGKQQPPLLFPSPTGERNPLFQRPKIENPSRNEQPSKIRLSQKAGGAQAPAQQKFR
jgi:hypothetical protein